jgi:hypothetical protein
MLRITAMATGIWLGCTGWAAAYCSTPSAPYCASSFMGFSDEYEFDDCKSDIEDYKSEVEDYLQCIQRELEDQVSDLQDEAKRNSDNAISEFNDAVDSFNNRASY